MKSLILKKLDDELKLYQQGVFPEDENLILFSLEEFLEFQEELKKSLNPALEIVQISQNQKSGHSPPVDAQRILNWIKKTGKVVEELEKKQDKHYFPLSSY